MSVLVRIGSLCARCGNVLARNGSRYSTTGYNLMPLEQRFSEQGDSGNLIYNKCLLPLEGNWFSEQGDSSCGDALSLRVTNVICEEKSKFQKILIFDSESFGRVLVLDGVIQCTSRDEFIYHEMITHMPMFSHLCPKSVLVVGGGDGGVLREVGKHLTVEEIHLCEIDKKVIELSKKYLPHVAVGFDNPKVKVHIQDGLEFLKDKEERFDIIITDSPSPTGPADALFETAYFQRLRDALRPDGIICMQGECVWMEEDMKLMWRVIDDCRKLFPVTTYAFICDPTCTTGQFGLVLASKNKDTEFKNPVRKISAQEADEMKLCYYDSQVHEAALLLPRFVRKGQWFSEQGDQFNSGHAVSLKVKNVVCHEKSKFQDILIFDSESCGRVFVLDGMLQCTSKNEFAYHEMITHIPMFCHPCPKSVLVVGGGDGGVLREVGKHPMVEEIHLCDLDEKVIELSKKYLPHVAIGFDNPKVQVHIQDGQEFLEDKKERFDVIITDSSDPIGPADTLFELAYFQRLKDALRPDGIICMQGECVWIKEDMELMQRVMNDCRKLFPVTTYAFISDPTCTTGQIGIVLASKNEDLDFGNPLRKISEQEADEMNLRYYDSQVHKGAVVLPRFVKKGLGL